MRFEIFSVECNRQRLDGGSMFGNVPHALWHKWIAADDRMRIELATRAFLVIDHQQDLRMLLDTGIGAFFAPELRDRYGVDAADNRLLANLKARGVAPEDLDFVILSHMHFDHAGGLLTAWAEEREMALVFPRARFVVHRAAWQRACAPHRRDRASFISQLPALLKDSGRLSLVDDLEQLGPAFGSLVSEGHTPGMMLTRISTERGSAAFCADLVPGLPWLHLPVTMGYDRFPERLIEEKEAFLRKCLEEQSHLLYAHDPRCCCSKVGIDERGKFIPRDARSSLDGLRL